MSCECKYQKSDNSDGCLSIIIILILLVTTCETSDKVNQLQMQNQELLKQQKELIELKNKI